MGILEIQNEIRKLKKEKDICILAHSYIDEAITEIADFVGDSYALAKKGADVKNKNIIMCGVRFMAETVKILSPEKNVYLANPMAGCPMAEQFDVDIVNCLKEENPSYAVVAYINTTSLLKTVCDVCVTSSSAETIIKKMPEKDIIFIPDINLGTYISKKCPEKNIKLLHGGCPTHARVTIDNVRQAKAEHPNAKLLVHPECISDVCAMADYVGSTSGIMNFAKENDYDEYIIGTENSIVTHLQYECPNKHFYPLSKDLICSNMKITTLPQVLECCKGEFGEKIVLDDDVAKGAKRCLDKMIEYGG